MKPAPFQYHAPASVEEVLALLAEHGDEAKVLAGGQSLVPAMNFRLAQPSVLVDLGRIPELAYVREVDGGLAIGAMTRQRTVERSDLVAARAPLVAETLPHVAHPQIRNRGTFGGSIAHADPAAELPAVLLALAGSCRLRGPRGERVVAAADFFTGLFETALEPDELLLEVMLPPLPAGSGWAFCELARRHGDYALVGVAATLTLSEGRVESARIAYLSVGEGPVLAPRAAAALAGRSPDEETIRAAAAAAAHHDVDPTGDIHASADYRRHLVEVLTRRALHRAARRAGPIEENDA
ncbi:MAG: xanthine dehydrogenase family protein subunit M [Acidobacteria bacterium]|nr:MAG: xanthine dehydrogenase family protein subunit M [Acidobacteriota bacterium]